jgi:hypothetical protein
MTPFDNDVWKSGSLVKLAFWTSFLLDASLQRKSEKRVQY